MMTLISLIPILFYLAIFLFVVYAIAVSLRLMKERNQYLRDIRDEMRQDNR